MTTSADRPMPKEDAPFLSLAQLLDRDREDHNDRHERDYARHSTEHDRVHVNHEERHARDREVAEQDRLRQEREVEKTAQRIELAVKVALDAVTQTQDIHQLAHQKEHDAHTNVHLIEAGQVKRAEETQRETAHVLSNSLESYKHESNEWRNQLREQENKFLRKDEANVIFETLRASLNTNSSAILQLRETVITTFSAQTGKTEGISDTAKVVIGAAGFLATLITIVGAIVAFGH